MHGLLQCMQLLKRMVDGNINSCNMSYKPLLKVIFEQDQQGC